MTHFSFCRARGEAYAFFTPWGHIQVLTPKAPAYFSERNGYRVPVLRFLGWRVFLGKRHGR